MTDQEQGGRTYYDSQLRRANGKPIRFAAPTESQAAVLSRATVTEADGDPRVVVRMVALVMLVVNELIHPDDANWLDSRMVSGEVSPIDAMAQLGPIARLHYKNRQVVDGETVDDAVTLVD